VADWRKAVLEAIGAKATPENLRFLTTWQRWEGGHTKNGARFNWLNTTKAAPGAVGSINSVGVKKFNSFQNGVLATAATLMNGRYDDLVAGLTSGNPYKFDVSKGLQTWVSGEPDGNPEYARKVLGGKAVSKRLPSPAAPRPTRPGTDDSWATTVNFIFGDSDPEFASILSSIPPDHLAGDVGPTARGEEVPRATGKKLQVPTTWAGSHVTDNLDWNRGAKTAVDIMAAPGTAVLAPESGRILRHGSAQGGQSLYFLSDKGKLYWMGHIDEMAPAGSRVKKGQRIASISSDHAAPHLHLDKYEGNDPGRYA
jgi:murein DD-endopeptidase MepM/ murein hydrolase activator NlpD